MIRQVIYLFCITVLEGCVLDWPALEADLQRRIPVHVVYLEDVTRGQEQVRGWGEEVRPGWQLTQEAWMSRLPLRDVDSLLLGLWGDGVEHAASELSSQKALRCGAFTHQFLSEGRSQQAHSSIQWKPAGQRAEVARGRGPGRGVHTSNCR